MAGVMIGVDPHKASHTAVAINGAEEQLGQLRVRACAVQAERLLEWAAAWPERTWAVEEDHRSSRCPAAGIGHPAGRGRGRSLRARRGPPRGPAPHRRATARDQEEA